MKPIKPVSTVEELINSIGQSNYDKIQNAEPSEMFPEGYWESEQFEQDLKIAIRLSERKRIRERLQ